MKLPLIELARESDIPSCVRLANWAAEHTTANFATEPESDAQWLDAWRATAETHPWLVARDGGAVVGFAKASPHRTRGAYAFTAEVTVYIDPAQHRRGIGRALYSVLISTLRAQGFVLLLAGITIPNEPSVRLHEAFGFVRCATYHRVGWKFGRWHDVGYWELHLHAEDRVPTAKRLVHDVVK